MVLVYYRVNDQLRTADSAVINVEYEKKRLNASFLRAVGAVLWPALLFSVICEDDRSNKLLIVPLLVNTVIWYLDSMLINKPRTKGSDDTISSLRLEASTFATLAFSVSNLIGNRPNSKYTHLFLYAVMALFVVVLPSHNLDRNCLEAQIFDNVQKSVLLWCICFIIAAVVLTRYHQFNCTVRIDSETSV